ncbi:MAG: hypothetical protein GY723_23350 [bacterium]|nr:hypothetical protein [bacterium]MCP5066744.1 hypothetical protein [bacterium]
MNGLCRHCLVLMLTLTAVGCTTPLELGERRYREGDRRAALEAWRGIRPDAFVYEAAQRRIDEVEEEFQQLVVRYQKRGAYYEARNRLAESVLNYRLALSLQPDDTQALAHVQELVRVLAAERGRARGMFREHFEADNLSGARDALDDLRTLDPFSAEVAADARELGAALDGQIRKLLARGRRGFTSGDLRRADQAFHEVLALDEDNESAQGYLSYITKIRTSSSSIEESTPAGPDPREIDASDAEIRAEGFFQNALAAERAGDLYAAIRYDLAALRIHSAHPRVRSHLVRLRRQLEPRLPDLLRAGREHYQQEDLQAALDQWRKVLLIDPRNKQARDYTMQAERLLENLERLRGEPTRKRNAARR